MPLTVFTGESSLPGYITDGTNFFKVHAQERRRTISSLLVEQQVVRKAPRR